MTRNDTVLRGMAKETNKEKALVALVESPSIADAAEKCGLSKETLFRYLKDKDFVRNYRQARRSVMESGIAEMQHATSEAVQTLKRNLTCGNPFAEVSAARAILDNALKGSEILDLSERLEALENAVSKEN